MFETRVPGSWVSGLGDAVLPVLFDIAEEGLVFHGPDGAVAEWNSAAERILGIPGERLAGSHSILPGRQAIQEDGQPMRPEDEPACVALRTGRPCRAHAVRLQGADGNMTWLLLSAATLPAAEGDGFGGVLTVIRDISEERAAERRQGGTHRMEAIGRLAGGVAHDFNNLITAIIGYNDMLLGKLQPADPGRHAAEQVREVAERAADLTHQLLAFSRRQVLELRVLDLNEVLAGMQSLLRHLVGAGVHLHLDTAVDVGTVRADRAQLEQVLMNLAINARDAMPAGGEIHIATRDVVLDREFEDAHPGSRAGRCVLLSVADSGCGMDGETLSHIFEPFFTTKPHDKGTGLGLSTVYGIVKQSGGFIDVESAPGRGSTFRIYLPRCDEVAAPELVVRCRAELPGREMGTSPTGIHD
jgi:PAS domain S-box-containing protein